VNNMKIIDKLKVSYPAQDSEIGAATVKVVLCKDEKKDTFSASIGIGEDQWVVKNGRPLRYEELSYFFTGYELIKDKYVI